MADSIRQQIIDEVIDQLETITIENGYKTDAGKSIYEWRKFPVNKNETPCLIVADPECEITEEEGSIHDHRLTIEIGIIESGADTSGSLRELIADVCKAIGIGARENWNDLAYDTEPGGDSTDIEHRDRIYGDTSFKIIICYRTPAWDPYETSNA
ncbi:MAG TPA: hypothetical protein VMV77_14200 [Bacteroidales bacterium]|nr:hypothetical protein [Bacteroidales bacterium]